MKATEKIWINPSMDLPKLNGIIDRDSVQYIRTDAFIEKACEWLRENKNRYVYNKGGHGDYIPTCSNKIIEDFKKYMKGE